MLRENPERRWSLDDLAAEVHLSPSRLSSVFVESYGKTPLAFLTMIRAEQLAKHLRESSLTVTAAMQQVGWNSRSHATRLFRQYVGITPGQYRRMRRQIARSLLGDRTSFVYRQTVLRCLLKRSAIERTLSPLALAVLF